MLFQDKASAQESIGFSVFPGYHILNSDQVSGSPNVSQTDWVFGGNLVARFHIKMFL
ncbi:MAG: hypothetical protein LAT67_14750 [Balneolales bacterium]|nr:hypothetical protein [Balneolales bacterium]